MSILKKSCAASAAALIAAAGIAPAALAQSFSSVPDAVTGAGAENSIVLSKQIDASTATPTNGDTYTFSFEQTLLAGTTAVTTMSSTAGENDEGAYLGPDIADVTLTASTMTADQQILCQTLTLPGLDKAETVANGYINHAGMYEYIVTESATNVGSDTAAADWDMSQAVYIMRLYVVNDDTAAGGLAYDGITVEQIVDDAGSSQNAAGKVDPTDDDNDSSTPSEFLFKNTYEAKADLKVTKNIIGEYANMDHEFPFSITLDLPAVDGSELSVADNDASAFTYTIYKRSGGAVSQQGTDTAYAVSSGAATVTVSLADDEYVVFNDLPVGTKYSVQETSNIEGANEYNVMATAQYKGASGATGVYATKTNYFGVAGSTDSDKANNAVESAASTSWTQGSLTVNNTSGDINTQTQVGIDGADVLFTNALENPPSPTGLAIQYGPYVLLTVAAAAGLTYLVSRRRRESEED